MENGKWRIGRHGGECRVSARGLRIPLPTREAPLDCCNSFAALRETSHAPYGVPLQTVPHSAFSILHFGLAGVGSEGVVGADFIRAHSRDSRAAPSSFPACSLRSLAPKSSAGTALLCGFDAEEELSADRKSRCCCDHSRAGAGAGYFLGQTVGELTIRAFLQQSKNGCSH